MKLKFILSILALLLITACNKDESDNKIKENTQLKAEQTVDVENNNIEYWSKQLEEDLLVRRRFIDAVTGEFEGEFSSGEGESEIKFGIRIIISSSFPSFNPHRIRIVQELVNEINNLNLNIHVVQWPLSNPHSAVGCIFTSIKPDLVLGQIDLFKNGCSSYKLSIGDQLRSNVSSEVISQAILNSEIEKANILKGTFQASSNAPQFKISTMRVINE
ncbi:MAG: hypothetical protein ACI9QD_000862 [Thermoproteota archaeon]|jgi:hypothetical protein